MNTSICMSLSKASRSVRSLLREKQQTRSMETKLNPKQCMLELLAYIVFFGVVIVCATYAYIRLKFGFWALQPVYHIYDVHYAFRRPHIVQTGLPEKNKYTNFKEVDTMQVQHWTSIQKQRFMHLIQTHYLQNGNNVFSPTLDNVMPYFVGHGAPCFASFFYKDTLLLDVKQGTTATDRKIVGAITSRPLRVFLSSRSTPMDVYYVDYLCVDKNHRKKNIAPQLIQTHHYNQRLLNNKNILVSFFKREDELTGIVPLCVYSTYGFPVTTWTKPADLSAHYQCLEITPHNFRFVYDFLREQRAKFEVSIETSMANLMELLNTGNVYATAVMCDKQILSCYFFRKTCVEIEKGLEVLSCFASIQGNCDEAVFVQGFKISFWKIAEKGFFGFCAMEDIGHNTVLTHNIMLKTKPTIVSPTAYYLYNFIHPTLPASKVLCLT